MMDLGVGSKSVPRVAAVAMKFAHAKLVIRRSVHGLNHSFGTDELYLIPVVTATCPSRLNHPVIQLINGADSGGESIAAQK